MMPYEAAAVAAGQTLEANREQVIAQVNQAAQLRRMLLLAAGVLAVAVLWKWSKR